MKRMLNEKVKRTVTPLTVSDPIATIESYAANGNFSYLLAHADDGVTWGKVSDKVLATHTPLNPDTLQQARLFGEKAEVYLWRDEAGWHGRLLNEGDGEEKPVYDEAMILWGTNVEKTENGFTLLIEGEQGIRHALPSEVIKEKFESHSLKLLTRHYLDFDDETGAAYVAVSRLVGFNS